MQNSKCPEPFHKFLVNVVSDYLVDLLRIASHCSYQLVHHFESLPIKLQDLDTEQWNMLYCKIANRLETERMIVSKMEETLLSQVERVKKFTEQTVQGLLEARSEKYISHRVKPISGWKSLESYLKLDIDVRYFEDIIEEKKVLKLDEGPLTVAGIFSKPKLDLKVQQLLRQSQIQPFFRKLAPKKYLVYLRGSGAETLQGNGFSFFNSDSNLHRYVFPDLDTILTSHTELVPIRTGKFIVIGIKDLTGRIGVIELRQAIRNRSSYKFKIRASPRKYIPGNYSSGIYRHKFSKFQIGKDPSSKVLYLLLQEVYSSGTIEESSVRLFALNTRTFKLCKLQLSELFRSSFVEDEAPKFFFMNEGKVVWKVKKSAVDIFEIQKNGQVRIMHSLLVGCDSGFVRNIFSTRERFLYLFVTHSRLDQAIFFIKQDDKLIYVARRTPDNIEGGEESKKRYLSSFKVVYDGGFVAVLKECGQKFLVDFKLKKEFKNMMKAS